MSTSVPPGRPERRRPRPPAPSDSLLPIPPPLTQNLPRRFGDYLVTSELSRDALGRVFRGIDVSGNGEFVRLRIFDTRRVDAPMLIDAIEASEAMRPLLAGPFTARGERAGSVDRLPYVVWRETHGWTLDVLLNGFRGSGLKLPPEHALLIGDRIAAALDAAHRTSFEGRPIVHGLVWPGFVSIGADADIFVAGFGLAPGIFPTLEEPTLAAGIAPYIAPEERLRPRLAPGSDIYSVGAVLLEMLTGRPPAAEIPVPAVAIRKEDGLPEDVVQLLRGALAKPSLRFSTMGAFRRELGRVIVAGRYAPSSFALSQLLSKRLGPQSIHHAEAAALAEESRRRSATTRPRVLPPGAPPQDLDAEVDSVLRNFWSRAETT